MPQKDKKHVLVLPRWYPNPDYISQGIFVQRHALCVAPYWEVSVLDARSDNRMGRFRIRRAFSNEDGLDTWRYTYPKRITGIGVIDQAIKLSLYAYCILSGYFLIKKEKSSPDLVNAAVLMRTGVMACLLRCIQGVPFIVTEHWTGYLGSRGDYLNAPLRRWLTPPIIRRSSGVCPASHDLGRAMRALGLRGRYETVHNVVDTDVFRPNPEARRRGHPELRLLSVAMLEDQHKNISGILNVLARIRAQGLPFRYDVLGQGDDRSVLEAHAERLGLSGQVHFGGLKPGEEVARMMQEADMLVLFSNFENLPCVIMEAMACGTPVISTDVGGISEIITAPGLGVLIPRGDEAALLQAIQDVATGRLRFDHQAITEHIRRNFGKEHIGKRLNEVYLAAWKA